MAENDIFMRTSCLNQKGDDINRWKLDQLVKPLSKSPSVFIVVSEQPTIPNTQQSQ
ncbi:unnamed protein product [Fusarium graminearum]|uniref:Chromosome 2, complete genome n=1 Tax=Gibberella zeae (strain ATCC MYA-4620 / CBS 123657 / FGSC 9075 / NRRL 31084 / PH-1) TaxID=229533 RepID=A0A098DFP6_GIBZE|nr:unnamed protein product [Fusarium graminearum]